MWNNEDLGGISGKVLDRSGKPIRGASVEAVLGRGSPGAEIRVSGEDGSFEYDAVPAGRHFVRITAKGFMVGTADVEVPKGQVVRFSMWLETGLNEIAGRVTEDGKRPLKAELTLLRAGVVIKKATAGERTGGYRFRNLSEGYYELQANSPCHAPRSWAGALKAPTRADLVLPVVENCVTVGRCDVCELTKEVRYCSFCHAFICSDCRHNYPERVKAMIRRRLRRSGAPQKEGIESIYERELKDLPRGQPCGNCP